MLIRNSISNTTKFFQKTFINLKSFFSKNHYKKLPKSPPNYNPYMNNNSTTQQVRYKNLDNFYADFTKQLDSISKIEDKKKIVSSTLPNPIGQIGQQVIQSSRSFKKPVKSRKEENNFNSKRGSVIEKLKELEMMDLSNLDHVLDVEQVVYYYSRLTCPFYLEIVDNFFMELYPEFFDSTTTYSTTRVM